MSVTSVTSSPAAAPPVETSSPGSGEIGYVLLDKIIPSRTNPRKTFEGPEFDELVASICQHGVLQPVLVRPRAVPEGEQLLPIKFMDDKKWCVVSRDEEESITDSEEAGAVVGVFGPRFDTVEEARAYCDEANAQQGYELVCGERRYRGAIRAGLDSIPATVRDLSDTEAREIQIVENLQRLDVSALEEAEGFRQLLESMQAEQPEAGQKDLVQAIAQKIGKSVRYVYARMQLTGLIAPIRQALAEGKIEASHADLLVRMGPERQKEVFEDEFCEYDDSLEGELAPDAPDPMRLLPPDRIPSVRALKSRLESNAPALKKAAWKWQKEKEDTLVQPACSGCEHNTATESGDAKNARCLNEECFAQKTKNFVDVRIEDLKAKTGKDFVKVSKNKWSTPKGAKGPDNWRSAKIGSCDAVVPAIVVNYQGEWLGVLTVCLNKKCKEHFGASGSTAKAESQADIQRRAEEDKRKAEVKRENAIRAKLLTAALAGITKLTPELFRLFVQEMTEDWRVRRIEKIVPGAVTAIVKAKVESVEFARAVVASLFTQSYEACDYSGPESCKKEFHELLSAIGYDWQSPRAKFAAEYDNLGKNPKTPEKKAAPETSKKAAAKKSKQPAKKVTTKKVSVKKGGRK